MAAVECNVWCSVASRKRLSARPHAQSWLCEASDRWLFLPDGEHGTGRLTHYLFSHAAQEEVRKARASVCCHDNQFGSDLFCNRQNALGGITYTGKDLVANPA